MSMSNPLPVRAEANWYADPTTPGMERYWDGFSWTSHVRPASVGAVAASGPWAPGAPAQPVTRSNTFSIIAIVLGVLSLLFFPIVFGPVGLILGGIGKSKGESLATPALVVAGVGMALGMIAGLIVGAAAL